MENKPAKTNFAEGLKKSEKDQVNSYYKRSTILIKSAQDLHSITGAHVKVQAIPIWPNGVRREFISDGVSVIQV